jgi:hypothetical protein
VGVLLAALFTVVADRPSTAASEVRLAFAGDFDDTSQTTSVLDAIKSAQPDAAFALGDLSYSNTQSEYTWCSYVKGRLGSAFPFQLVAGNHEDESTSNGTGGHINNFSACLPNQIPGAVGVYGREYYVDMPSSAPLVRVVNISPSIVFEDGTWNYASGDAHYTWTAAAIDGARSAGIPWVVVNLHYNCLSPGGYSCGVNSDLVALLHQRKVDLVFNGHDHFYARTHQLALGSGCPAIATGGFDADCVADNDGDFVAGNGTVTSVVGTGGVALRDVNAGDPEVGYFASFSGANRSPSHGFTDVRITDTEISAQFTAATGSHSDSFHITKGSGVPPAPVANDDTASTTVGTAATVSAPGVLANDSGTGISVTGNTTPSHGTATVSSNGSYTYTPAGGFEGTDAFDYTITDSLSRTSTATVAVTVSQSAPPSGNLLRNAGLEEDADNNQVPDCWMRGGFGTNTYTWALTSEAHGGNVAQELSVTSWSRGDRKLVVAQDTGTCAPSVTAGNSYRASVWYRSTVPSRIIAYYRDSGGTWRVWFGGPSLPASAGWAQTSVDSPAVPAGATHLSYGLAVSSVGTLVTDDYTLTDLGP